MFSSADIKTSVASVSLYIMVAVYVYLIAGVSYNGASALQLASSHYENKYGITLVDVYSFVIKLIALECESIEYFIFNLTYSPL